MKPAILITVLVLVAIVAISAIPTSRWGLSDERRPLHEFSKENFRNKLMDYIMNHEKRCRHDYCSPGDSCCGGRCVCPVGASAGSWCNCVLNQSRSGSNEK